MSLSQITQTHVTRAFFSLVQNVVVLYVVPGLSQLASTLALNTIINPFNARFRIPIQNAGWPMSTGTGCNVLTVIDWAF